ncbi:MAG: exonuclease domain-containing protein [Thermoplasmatota archaeon]
MKVVAFDLETTGVDAEKDRIVEFCFIELNENLEEQGRWSKLINPGIPIPQETIDIHGITDEMVADQPGFAHHASRIQKLVDGAVLVGHSVRFDVGFLHNELIRAGQKGLDVNHPTIDTVQIERNVNSHRLAACYERYTGQTLDDAHRSEADIAATVDVLRHQRQVHAAKLPADLDGLIGPRLHRHFNPDDQSKEWLDHGRKFYREGATTYFAFGKFRGQAIDAGNADHTSYLSWMRDRDFPEDTKAVAIKLLDEAVGGQQRLDAP